VVSRIRGGLGVYIQCRVRGVSGLTGVQDVFLRQLPLERFLDRAANSVPDAGDQGLTLIHFSAQCERFLWVPLGTFSRYMGHNSPQSGHKTAH